MRKRLIKAAAVLLFAFTLVFTNVCLACADSQYTEIKQETAVKKEKYQKDKAFRHFLEISEKKYLIPGLNQAVIPQGMDYSQERDTLYISGYYKIEDMPSAIMSIDCETGMLKESFRLYNSDGTAFASHVGGVAVAGDRLYISAKLDNDGSYSIAEISVDSLEADNAAKEVVVEKTIQVPVSPSFMNYSDGKLWIGNFYHPSAGYGLSPEIDYTVKTGDGEQGCYILGYDPQDLTKPVIAFSAPDKIQGMTCKDGKIILSQSYGRKNDSYILVYKPDFAEAHAVLNLSGADVPLYILDEACLCEEITAMPMTEALCEGREGELLVLFESGALAYSDGTGRTDHIWKLNIE